jgi:hypothetical protein
LRVGKEAVEKSIQELNYTIGVLEDQVQELKEREKLIVEYPDLNGPVNADFTGMFKGRILAILHLSRAKFS